MLRVLVVLACGFLLAESRYLKKRQEESCERLAECATSLENFFVDEDQPSFLSSPDEETLERFCKRKDEVEECIEETSSGCDSEAVGNKVDDIFAVANFLCSDKGKQVTLAFADSECATDKDKRQELHESITGCVLEFKSAVEAANEEQNPGPSELCPLAASLTECVVEAGESTCGGEYAEFFSDSIAVTLRSRFVALDCDDVDKKRQVIGRALDVLRRTWYGKRDRTDGSSTWKGKRDKADESTWTVKRDKADESTWKGKRDEADESTWKGKRDETDESTWKGKRDKADESTWYGKRDKADESNWYGKRDLADESTWYGKRDLADESTWYGKRDKADESKWKGKRDKADESTWKGKRDNADESKWKGKRVETDESTWKGKRDETDKSTWKGKRDNADESTWYGKRDKADESTWKGKRDKADESVWYGKGDNADESTWKGKRDKADEST